MFRFCSDRAMTKRTRTAAADKAPPIDDFIPVSLRARRDGWTHARQIAFLQALAETACVADACRQVGMTTQSAYVLRHRADAESFRAAWDVALDFGVSRLAESALSRAIHGVATPVFFQGEQVGERRSYNERLTMFLLRYRQPQRYGAALDTFIAREPHPDAAALRLKEALRRVAEDGVDAQAGRSPRDRPPLTTSLLEDIATPLDPELAVGEWMAEQARERDYADRFWRERIASEVDRAWADRPESGS